MSLVWKPVHLTVDHRAIGFVTGLVLGLALLHLIQARAMQEIILDFTTVPAITAPAAEDSGLLLSYARGPASGPDKLRSWRS